MFEDANFNFGDKSKQSAAADLKDLSSARFQDEIQGARIRLADGGGSPGTYEPDPEERRRPRDDDYPPFFKAPSSEGQGFKERVDPVPSKPPVKKMDGGGSPGTYEPDPDDPRRRDPDEGGPVFEELKKK